MTQLQNLYWQSQTIHDQLAAIEHTMRKITKQGKSCVKTQAKYLSLMDDLRDVNAQMTMLEEGSNTSYSRLLRHGESVLITCV